MRPLRAVAALLMFAGVVLVLTPSAVDAAVLQQGGWWYRPTTGTPLAETPVPGLAGVNPTIPPAPGPPNVSAEHLHVEGAASGATAIAGLTYNLAEGESSPVLTLAPADGSVVPPNAVILACRAAIEWTAPATNPGPWESKPLADCATSVQGQVVDGTGVVFPLQPLLRGTLLDILIVPGTVAELPAQANGSVFSLTFARPGPDALVTTGGEGAVEDFVPSITFDEDFSFEPITTPPEEFFTAPVPTATFDAFVAPTAPVVEPALPPQDQAPSVPREVLPAVSIPDTSEAARKLGLALLVAGAIFAFMTSGAADAAGPADVMGLGRFRRARPAAAGALADGPPVEGGVGRLRRPRTGPVPSL